MKGKRKQIIVKIYEKIRRLKSRICIKNRNYYKSLRDYLNDYLNLSNTSNF